MKKLIVPKNQGNMEIAVWRHNDKSIVMCFQNYH